MSHILYSLKEPSAAISAIKELYGMVKNEMS